MTAETRNWSETKRRLRERWPGLHEEDIEASQGERTALLALLQGRFGYARPNAEQDLDEILGGETVVPEDVASERMHTGTSGPVGPVSEATDFAGGANRAVNGERGELPTQPPESTGGRGPASQQEALIEGSEPEGMRGAGGPPFDRDRWGRDPWESMQHGGHGMGSRKPMVIFGIVGVIGTVLLIRILAGRKRVRKQSKAEQVSEQARHLLEEIGERMPSVEEFRDRVRPLDEKRAKNALRPRKVAATMRRVKSAA